MAMSEGSAHELGWVNSAREALDWASVHCETLNEVMEQLIGWAMWSSLPAWRRLLIRAAGGMVPPNPARDWSVEDMEKAVEAVDCTAAGLAVAARLP